MKTTTQEMDIGQQLNAAVMSAAMPSGDDEIATLSDEVRIKNEKKQAVSPLSGAPVPNGRPLGVKNRLTNLREAVLEAFDMVGGAQYLAKLARGTGSDRAAFIGLVAKVLPSQVNATVDGGIQVQLSWLSGRSIGTTLSQTAEEVTQVIDLHADSKGGYRIIDPAAGAGEVTDADTPKASEALGGANDA
jgi:hypothetical protein